jgi:chemotaxis family two-component system sensor kinase Cph1
MEAVRTSLDAQIKEERATVSHGLLPTVLADENQMTALLQNLVSNSIKFHADRPPEVQVECERSRGEWLFSVRDNGIGIEPRYSEQVFQLFKRLHTMDEYPGTGIGLAIAKKIVERHGGRIWLRSTPGEGTTFYFTIPIGVVR